MNHKQLMSLFKPAHLVLLTLIISFAFLVTLVHADDIQPIHHWSFDGLDVEDVEAPDIPGGNTAYLIQSGEEDAVFVAAGGEFGGYFHKPDDKDLAMLSDPVSFADDQPWTVALWVSAIAGSNVQFGSPIGYSVKDPDGSGANREQIQLKNGKLAWVGKKVGAIKNEVIGPAGSGGLWPPGWVHIAVVSDGTSVTLYRDGVALITQVPAGNDTSWRINNIGTGKRSGGQSGGGDIDEVWVFSVDLTEIQIDELMNNNPPVVGAMHHWSFDESDVSYVNGEWEALDEFDGNTATIIQSDEDAEFVPIDGKFGGYFHEPDKLDEASLSSPVSFDDGDPWTVALWVNRRGSNFRIDQPGDFEYKDPRIITPIGNNENDSFREQIQLRRGCYQVRWEGKPYYWVHDRSFAWVGTGDNVVQGPWESGVLPADAWVHIAVVSDGSSVTLYRDGVELTPQLYVVTNTGWTFNSIGRGNYKDGENQGADLDEVWVFDVALSAEQIDTLMNFNTIDSDSDGDGIVDSDDQCPDTAEDAVVDDDGCSIAQICPADGNWKNHGAYVKCVAHTAESFVAEEFITEEEKDAIVSEAAQSDVGKKKNDDGPPPDGGA